MVFELFSPSSRAVLADAQAQAMRRRDIGTEHILLSLLTAVITPGAYESLSTAVRAPSPDISPRVPPARASIPQRSALAAALDDAGLDDSDRVRARIDDLVSLEQVDAGGVDLAPYGRLIPFTTASFVICRRAFRIAVMHDHPAVEPEHLLLSLVDETPETNALQVIEASRVTSARLQARLEHIVGQCARSGTEHNGAVDDSGLVSTPRLRHVLAAARQAALARGHRHVGVEHLMLAVLDDGSSLATAAIVETGTSLGQVRNLIERAMEAD